MESPCGRVAVPRTVPGRVPHVLEAMRLYMDSLPLEGQIAGLVALTENVSFGCRFAVWDLLRQRGDGGCGLPPLAKTGPLGRASSPVVTMYPSPFVRHPVTDPPMEAGGFSSAVNGNFSSRLSD